MVDKKESNKRYYQKNKDRIKKSTKLYRENHKEEYKKYNKLYRTNNKEKLSNLYKRWVKNNPEKVKLMKKRYRNKPDSKLKQNLYWEEHKLELKKYNDIYKLINKDKIKEKNKQYKQDNNEIIIQRQRIWREDNRVKLRKMQNKRYKERIINDVDYKMGLYLRIRIRMALQGKLKSDSTIELIGCDIKYLKDYLESQFDDEMSWTNWSMCGWHIDHIRPCASFDLSKEEEQRECFHYSNMQPLWARDNLRKGAKVEQIG